MSEINMGDPIPWEPISPQEIPVPIRERVSPGDLERARPFPAEPDSDILKELTELATSLGAGGRGKDGDGGKRTGLSAPPPDDDDSGPTDPVDALAWYLSFRSNREWGVYITRAGLLQAGSFFVRQGASPMNAYHLARYMLRNHETGHFLVDRAVLTLETTVAHSTGHRPPTLWLDYSRRHMPYSQLEEAVCNAYAYRMADVGRNKIPSAKNYVRAFMKRQPAGYCDVDFDRTNAGTIIGSFQLSESQLLSDYLAHRKSDEGLSRVIGLNSLMQYRNPEKGTRGDLFITRVGKQTKKEELPVFLV